MKTKKNIHKKENLKETSMTRAKMVKDCKRILEEEISKLEHVPNLGVAGMSKSLEYRCVRCHKLDDLIKSQLHPVDTKPGVNISQKSQIMP